VYLHKGLKEWEGSNKDIIYSTNTRLNDFIFASQFMKDAKTNIMNQAL
jgi:phospholipid/cholesterol/gamma-HCH transport system ATP-binding protein